VRNEARTFHAEDKPGRRLGIPFFIAGRELERIKGPVDLDRIERTAGKLELAALGEVLGVKDAPPSGIAPA